MPFFIDYLKQAGLFDAWVADCPLSFTSPNAPKKRDLLGTVMLSVLSGHRRYDADRQGAPTLMLFSVVVASRQRVKHYAMHKAG